MFNSTVLEVIIGLVFIYLLYSLLATIIQEIISTYLGLRSEMLKKGIIRMLGDATDDKDLTQSFYNHPLIKFLGENKSSNKPSYINSKNFSKVLIDLLRGEDVQPGQSYASIIQQSLNTGKTLWGGGSEISPQTLSFLKSLWVDAQGDVKRFAILLEQWFDETMDRASGWFKKKTQFILFFIGFTLAIIFNIDTISMVKKLSHDPKLATQLADNASVYIQNNKEILNQKLALADSLENSNKEVYKDQLDSIITESNKLINSANDLVQGSIKDSNKLLGLGWGDDSNDFCWWRNILGWIITALAISLGAPFWFDLLNRFMKLRGSVATPTSDDREKKQG
jgi:hypothetical protein